MHADGMSPKLLNLLKAYYKATQTKLCVYGQESEAFEVHSGVPQGCVLSPTLFNFAMDWITSHALESFPGVTVGQGFVLEDLDYADDIAILGGNFADIQLAIDEMQCFASQLGRKNKTADGGISPYRKAANRPRWGSS